MVLNPSDSVQKGIYLLDTKAKDYNVGDMICFYPDYRYLRFLIDRNYIPKGVPLLKKIAYTNGTTICVNKDTILANGAEIGKILQTDSNGEMLPAGRVGCYTLSTGEFFVFSPKKNSFDSRYFGPVDDQNIVGKTHLLIPFS